MFISVENSRRTEKTATLVTLIFTFVPCTLI